RHGSPRPRTRAECDLAVARPCGSRVLRYRAGTAERRWSGSDFRQYGQWRYQRVGVPSPGPTGNRLASVGDVAFRAARSDYRDRSRKAPLPLRAGNCDEGPPWAAPRICSGSNSVGGRDGLRRESGQVQPELFEDLAVEEAAFAVEPFVRTGDGDLRPDDAGAGDAEDPLQVLLGPESAELARARADDGDRLVPEHGLDWWAGGPVDR